MFLFSTSRTSESMPGSRWAESLEVILRSDVARPRILPNLRLQKVTRASSSPCGSRSRMMAWVRYSCILCTGQDSNLRSPKAQRLQRCVIDRSTTRASLPDYKSAGLGFQLVLFVGGAFGLRGPVLHHFLQIYLVALDAVAAFQLHPLQPIIDAVVNAQDQNLEAPQAAQPERARKGVDLARQLRGQPKLEPALLPQDLLFHARQGADEEPKHDAGAHEQDIQEDYLHTKLAFVLYLQAGEPVDLHLLAHAGDDIVHERGHLLTGVLDIVLVHDLLYGLAAHGGYLHGQFAGQLLEGFGADNEVGLRAQVQQDTDAVVVHVGIDEAGPGGTARGLFHLGHALLAQDGDGLLQSAARFVEGLFAGHQTGARLFTQFLQRFGVRHHS